MPKDPAILFYTSDFLTGTLTMTDEQVGKYIRLLCLHHQKGYLTEKDMISICKQHDQEIYEKFFKTEEGFYLNKRMQEEAKKRKKYIESRRNSKLKADEDNVRIYLLKDNDTGFIKIGSSVNPLRRYNEIANQTVSVIGSSKNRDYKLIWYSDATIRIKEKELHDRFSFKNVNGEWFDLTEQDIIDIKKEFKEDNSTYVERTENENININININDIILKKEEEFKKEVSTFKNYPSEMLKDFIQYWTEPNKSRTKLRYELEPTWDTGRRLANWAKNDKVFQKVRAPDKVHTSKNWYEIINDDGRTGQPQTIKQLLNKTP